MCNERCKCLSVQKLLIAELYFCFVVSKTARRLLGLIESFSHEITEFLTNVSKH